MMDGSLKTKINIGRYSPTKGSWSIWCPSFGLEIFEENKIVITGGFHIFDFDALWALESGQYAISTKVNYPDDCLIYIIRIRD
jgi:hypothetical protein